MQTDLPPLPAAVVVPTVSPWSNLIRASGAGLASTSSRRWRRTFAAMPRRARSSTAVEGFHRGLHLETLDMTDPGADPNTR